MKKTIFAFGVIFLVGIVLSPPSPYACTTIIVGKAATKDGSVLLAHNEELGNNSAHVYTVVPRKPHKAGDVYVLFSGATIPQPEETYAYIASRVFSKRHYPGDYTMGVNEYQVSIANNMAWTRDYATGEGSDAWRVDDEGVIWTEFTQLVLERARTAREGVELIGRLVENHGLTGDPGTIFAVADPQEGWFVEIAQGRQWIAKRVPDDRAVVYANTFRIGVVNLDDEKQILHSPGLVDYAVEKGWYAPDTGEPFHFARVYGYERELRDAGNTVRHDMVERKLVKIGVDFTAEHLMEILRWHYEDTRCDKSRHYALSPHETRFRTICCVDTEVSGVAHLRHWLPAEIGGVLWLCMGTPCSGVYIPFYMGHKSFPQPFITATSVHSSDSAYWAFADLTGLMDSRYREAHPIVRNHWDTFAAHIASLQDTVETRAKDLYAEDRDAARAFLTWYSNALANQAYIDAKRLADRLD